MSAAMRLRPENPATRDGSAPSRRFLMTYAMERWGGLDFRVALPETWSVEVPAIEAIEFGSGPAQLMPLLRAGDGDGCLQLQVGARPMRSTDRLVQRALALLGHQGIELEQPLREWHVGIFTGLCGRGLSGLAEHRRPVQVAFLDEARRIVQILLTGHAACSQTLDQLWPALLRSFRLVPSGLGASAAYVGGTAELLRGSD
jgi:hypothetical protein